jgi:release factor glutamine methyltransferase
MKQIVEAALEIDSVELLHRYPMPIQEKDAQRVEALLARRLLGEPFQYLVGYAWFWDSKFEVGPGVLIPRPETEHLVEIALARIPSRKIRVAELGAGSGAIGISLLKERPEWEWVAWEKSMDAAVFAERNRAALCPSGSYTLEIGDFFTGLVTKGPFDWFVSNPPYVRRGEIAHLSKEVRQEPFLALDGGESGLECLERLIRVAADTLLPGGGVILEIGSEQGEAVSGFLRRAGFAECAIERDLAGLDRVAYGRKV